MSPLALRLVLLDAVGTLVEPAEPVGETYARFAARQGAHVPPSRLEEAFRRVLRAAPPMVFPHAAPHETLACERAWWRARVRETFRAADQMVRIRDPGALFEALFDHYARPDAWRPRPGAQAALAALRAGGRRAAVASNFDHRLPAVLEGLGLGRWLEAVLRPADLGAAKPDPRFFLAACERLAEPPAHSVYVGDDPEQDLAPARRAGLYAIDVRTLATLEALPAHIDALEQEIPA